MAHVMETATKMGINHQYLPPHDPQLNDAEKMVDSMWSVARVHLAHTGAPTSVFALAVGYAMHVDMRMATTASREWKNPI